MEKRISTLFLAVATIAMAPHVLAARSTAPIVETDSDQEELNPPLIPDKATELAQIIFPLDYIRNGLPPTLRLVMINAFSKDPDMQLFETAYPGLSNHIATAMTPLLARHYEEKLPLFWSRLSNAFRANLSNADMVQLLSFYKSSLGMKILTNNRNGTSAIRMAEEIKKTNFQPEKYASAANVELTRNASEQFSKLSNPEKLAIFKFSNSLSGQKFNRMSPEIAKIQVEWDLYFTNRQKAEIASVRSMAIADFVEKVDAAKAKPAP